MKFDKIFRNIEALIIEHDYMDAEKYLLEIIRKDPQNPEAHYILGDVYCKLIKFRQAIEQAEIANTILPNNPQIIHLLGWAYFMSGNINIGRKYLEAALQITPVEIQLLCDLAVLETRAMNETALKYAKKALKLYPDDPLAQEVFLVTSNFFKAYRKLDTQIN